MVSRPYQNSALARFIGKRVAELQGTKSQAEIAAQAGFRTPNVVTMLKNGTLKLAFDRVPGLAQALETDPARLFRLALGQQGNELTAKTIRTIFATVLTKNELAWIEALRAASGESDPALTDAGRAVLREILCK